jgi:tetratricopeptide (TPR) repeat protein
VDAENAARIMKPVHMDRLERNGSLASSSRLLGRVKGYMAEQKDDPRGLRTQDALMSLKVAGVPMPEEVYHESYFSEPKDPSAILLYSRENQKLKRDPLLVELKPLLEELAAAGPTPEGNWEGLSQEIRALDYLRRRDRRNAYDRLGHLLLELLDKLKGASRPRAALGDLTSALGVLAAIYRLAGRRDDAVELLALSWPLAVLAKSSFARAEWHQKAAYLLIDLSRYMRADDFLHKAHILYDCCRAENERLRTLVDYGYLLTESSRHIEALEHLEEILPLLPEADTENRFAAHQLLATNCRELGRLPAAQSHLQDAIPLVGDDLLAKAYCLWHLADLLMETGDMDAGLQSYNEALPLFSRLTGATELAQLALKYAGFLLKDRRLNELRTLAADLAGWFKPLRSNLRLRAAIENFQALVDLDELTEISFSEISEQVATLRAHERQTVLARTRPSRSVGS